jgi:hypothetical protein
MTYNYDRTSAVKKMPSAQLEALLAPHKIKKSNATVQALIKRGYLEFSDKYQAFVLTPQGKDFVDAYKAGRPRMTKDNMSEIARLFERLGVKTNLSNDPEVGYPIIKLNLTDRAHGNMAVDTIDWAPTEAEAERIVTNLKKEIAELAKGTRTRHRYIPR